MFVAVAELQPSCGFMQRTMDNVCCMYVGSCMLAAYHEDSEPVKTDFNMWIQHLKHPS
jgi:hypothetical protein